MRATAMFPGGSSVATADAFEVLRERREQWALGLVVERFTRAGAEVERIAAPLPLHVA